MHIKKFLTMSIDVGQSGLPGFLTEDFGGAMNVLNYTSPIRPHQCTQAAQLTGLKSIRWLSHKAPSDMANEVAPFTSTIRGPPPRLHWTRIKIPRFITIYTYMCLYASLSRINIPLGISFA